MSIFTFYIDNKITIWERSYYNIESESLEKATQIAKNIFVDDSNDSIEPDEYEMLDNSQSSMTLEENQGCNTRELIFSENPYTIILSNGENSF